MTLIVGVGIDTVENRRIRRIMRERPSFVERVLAPCEVEYCRTKKHPIPHVAARFAAKEAVLKALGCGWVLGLRWPEVAVESSAGGKPRIKLSGGAKRLAEKLGVRTIHLSLTHTRAYASAQVVLER